ncbi:hypothetical protein [Streptomyces aidingensis]|uniref:Uncharacterized protein n=1 Tax=Streptomyces aidingensis TaxID=910347 RepID=A0A1I1Q8Y2_9ACTN|nr:hypothetical protein [Streptomyces aidingensis]SFD14580.1 hypothetical protein SAMN05421773_110127 [Streptomyces aidingensis]
MADDIAAFVAAHPVRPGFTAAQMIDVWEHVAGIHARAAASAASNEETEQHMDAAATRWQVIAATRWVQRHHGTAAADAFVTYLGDTSSARASAARA